MVRDEPALLQQLLDRQEIHDALIRYCRGVDRLDEALIRSAFHADAVTVYGAEVRSPAQMAADFMPLHRESYLTHQHRLSNVTVAFDGDVAYSESYVEARLRFERDGELFDFIFGGRYVDRFERRSGDWRIAHRVVVHDWDRIDPVVRTNPGTASMVAGLRSPDDLSYQRERPVSGQ